jgi:large subunit ribosomal protein L29
MNTRQLREKNLDGLKVELQDLLRAQFGLRMQKASQQLTNFSAIKKTRRAVARTRTLIHESSSKK